MEKSNTSLTFGVLGLVAIVAIVGMLTMFMGDTSVTPTIVDNTAGMAFKTTSSYSTYATEAEISQAISICADLDTISQRQSCFETTIENDIDPSWPTGWEICQMICVGGSMGNCVATGSFPLCGCKCEQENSVR